MIYRLRPYSIMDAGKRIDANGNPHQEDCLFPMPPYLSEDTRMFVLCDGMGGHDAGEVASSVVCKCIGERGSTMLKDRQDFSREAFNKILSEAYDALDSQDTGSLKKMGTTLATIVFHSKGVLAAHIGDSRIYQIRPGKSENSTRIIFQSEDHSLINDLIKAGELSKSEAQKTVKKNIITRAMQPNGERFDADIEEITNVKAGDWFYVCSDGMLEQEEMESGSALRRIFSDEVPDDREKISILKGATSENRDNHSAFIIKVEEINNGKVHNPLNSNATPSGFWKKIKSLF